MAIDLLNVEKVKVSTDLASYSTFIYGEPKSGKTTFIQNLYGEDVLFIGTENRFKAVEGAQVIPVQTWGEIIKVKAQLRKQEVKDKYKVIAIDTITRFMAMLDTYVAQVNGEEILSWQNYTQRNKLLQDYLNDIQTMGYTLVLVGHAKTKMAHVPKAQFVGDASTSNAKVVNDKKDGNKEYVDYEKWVPDVQPSALNVAAAAVDNILFIGDRIDEQGDEQKVIYLRGTLSWQAGSTFKNSPDFIPFSADAYRNAMTESVNGYDSTTAKRASYAKPVLDFVKLKKEMSSLAKDLTANGKKDEAISIMADIFGKGVGLKDIKEDQVEDLQSLVEAYKAIV
jgi:hypothetical protein